MPVLLLLQLLLLLLVVMKRYIHESAIWSAGTETVTKTLPMHVVHMRISTCTTTIHIQVRGGRRDRTGVVPRAQATRRRKPIRGPIRNLVALAMGMCRMSTRGERCVRGADIAIVCVCVIVMHRRHLRLSGVLRVRVRMRTLASAPAPVPAHVHVHVQTGANAQRSVVLSQLSQVLMRGVQRHLHLHLLSAMMLVVMRIMISASESHSESQSQSQSKRHLRNSVCEISFM